MRRGAGALPNLAGGRYTVLTLIPEVGYRLPRSLWLRLRAPLHWKTFDESSPRLHRETSGLGDLELLAGWDRRLPGGWRLSAALGLALPTGEHVAQPFVGQSAPTPLQLGGGTLDPLVALAAGYRRDPRWSAGARATARAVVMDNRDGYRPASVLEVGAAGQWRPWPRRLGLLLHIDYSHVTHVRVDGVAVSNTGRDTIYAEPGVTVAIAPGLDLEASARIPLYMRVNETQLAETALLAARLVYDTPPLF